MTVVVENGVPVMYANRQAFLSQMPKFAEDFELTVGELFNLLLN